MAKSNKQSTLLIGAKALTIADVVSVARHNRKVALAPEAKTRVALSRAVVDTLLERNVKIYGITTGFASLRDRRIDAKDAARLSENLIKSHAAGVGQPFAEDVVRGSLLVRAQALALGYSGVRVEFLEAIVAALNNRAYPLVPEQGSVGSSGDLAPLSHLFLALIGDPHARIHKACLSKRAQSDFITDPRADDFVELKSIPKNKLPFKPISLTAKEGLAANNGAVFSAVVTALAVHDTERLLRTSENVTALSFEALQAVPDCLLPELTGSRPYAGHQTCAKNILSALSGSSLSLESGASGFNMARINRAMLRLAELMAVTKDKADYSTLKKLHDAMAEFQERADGEIERHRKALKKTGGRPQKEIELLACNAAFDSLHNQWRYMIGLAETTSPLGPDTRASLQDIYHQHVKRIVRPETNPDVQDNYSYRASATVAGAARDALEYSRKQIETEINSATDNPLILLEALLKQAKQSGKSQASVTEFRKWLRDNWHIAADHIKSAANFHGEPIGFVADHLSVALAELGNISERRSAALMDEDHSKGLPSYLVWKPGLNSGLMLLQYTAASLATENKTLAVPAVTDSIPTGESCEDHNSMSTLASRKLAKIVTNVTAILAIELFSAYQGVQFRKPNKLGKGTTAIENVTAKTLGPVLIELGASQVKGGYSAELSQLGLSKSACKAIRPCVIDDITTHPALKVCIKLIHTGAIADATK